KEPAEALLLSIEELLRAGKPLPDDSIINKWCRSRVVDGHLALLVLHAGSVRGEIINQDVIDVLKTVKIPPGDSLLGRIKSRLVAP
ncbi:MAG TPA: hypothetical protein QGF70_04425, partial [Candidatus Thalassarchaeaceae archaeon]|nr:hypothetical protein [Candidatus Thalassarchaeaceae archaeon]